MMCLESNEMYMYITTVDVRMALHFQERILTCFLCCRQKLVVGIQG